VSGRAVRLVALGVVTAAILAYGGSSLARVWQLSLDVEALEREIGALRAETGRLTATVDRLRTDPAAIEQIARERIGLVKPGERVLKLPPTSPVAPGPDSSALPAQSAVPAATPGGR
jgi:cell division protein FtsB